MVQPNIKKKSHKKLYIFGGLGLLAILVIIIAIIQGSKDEITVVQTEKVQRRTITQTVTATGKIDPEFKVQITPEVTGEIVSLPVKEGDVVKKGDVLIKIKADTYIAQVQSAQANLQSARASESQHKAELDKITLDYNRIKELHAKKLSSDAEIEASRSSYLSAKAILESAQSFVSQNEAAVKQAVEQLNKTTITSPLDGTVTQLNVRLGERVLGSGFSQGTNIMTVANLSDIEAIVDVDENDIVLIKMGDTARVSVDAFGDRKFTGLVTEIGNTAIQSGTGTQDQVINFEVKIKITDPDAKLRSGMSCNARIETATKNNVIAVPLPSVTARSEMKIITTDKDADNANSQKQTAVKKTTNKPDEIVFLTDNGKAKVVKVKTGLSDDNYIEITEGLKENDDVISGSYKAISRDLHDGAIIRVDNNRGPKPAASDKK
jgi:HlyD family secretion protein